MRALPFLGSKGNFDYWEGIDRQRHLFSVFYIFDLALRAYVGVGVAAAAAAAYARAAALATRNIAKVEIEQAILQDLSVTKAGKRSTISIRDYGLIWDNFQSALEKEGCSYWGRVYRRIFENDFEVNEAELERRLSVPKEIRAQGAAAVGSYLEALEKGAQRLNEARILILGDKGAGKTCVARRLIDMDADMTTPEESTAGVDTKLWVLEKQGINVRVWDFAGHTVTHAVHQFFLSERCLYLIVYDGRTEKRNRLEYWLSHMKNYGGDSQAIILVNERDRHAVNIPINSLKERFPIAGIYSFNVRDDREKLLAFREEVANYIQTNPSWENQKIPTSYYLVKEELEKRFQRKDGGKAQEHISKEDFIGIAKKHEVEDPERLLKDLHALGVSLWYQDMDECGTLILNPEWISQGVYKIINWASAQQTHELRLEDFAKVFEAEQDAGRFPKDKHGFLYNLLMHYELAFETKQGGKRLIVPHLLPEDQPATLPGFEPGESLQMRYEADMPLPPNTISRFIVRHNEQIKREGSHWRVWKHGVILEDGKGSLALVREIDRSISVSVKGAQGRSSSASCGIR